MSSDSSSKDDSDAIPNTQLEDNMELEEDIFAAQLQVQDNKVKTQLNEDPGKSIDIYMTVAEEERLPLPPASNAKRKKEVSKDPVSSGTPFK
ncbi:hypothetical protein L7F22_034105 [Adiantum nelumboides]|nr:hypothetical protein [Adiantum nelumboides]